jgi:hypothetical protein
LRARRQFDYIHRKARQAYQLEKQEELAHAYQSSRTDFWRKIQSIGISKDRKQHIPLHVKSEDGSTIGDLEQVLDTWRTYFTILLNDQGNTNFDEEHYQHVKETLHYMESEDPTMNDEDNNLGILNSDILFSEVKSAVKRAKFRKSTGTDSIPNEVLKNDVCINMLFRLISFCFEHSIVPSQWQTGIISPIYKDGVKNDPTNYRGITLLNTTCKIYCDVLNARLRTWLEENEKLREEQNGFRTKRSCQDHIYVLYSLIKTRLCNKLSTYACFVDARKAFDRVNRECLWFKLQSIGIKGKMYDAVKSLYSNVKCFVKLNGCYVTKPFDITQGVKQGCNISPTLFSIYINDLASELDKLKKGVSFGQNKLSILMFADDVVLLAENEEDLQSQMNCLLNWCTKWRLDLNLSKTKIVHFRQRYTPLTNFNFYYGTEAITKEAKYKYLGLWFHENLDLNFTVREVAKSASRALGVIIAKFKSSGGMSYHCYTKLYETMVQPVLMYGAALWGTSEHKIIATVQNKACRFFLGLCSKTHNLATSGDMGWKSVKCKQMTEVARQSLRIKSLNPDRLTYKDIAIDKPTCMAKETLNSV